ncbi:glycosyltransferase [Tetragenococcus halophilus]|uniref:glycosyltransferase n=1 Tax=Tetragenococcus halophilus TaxID=51669 RepID=UPI0030F247A1
MFGKKLVYKNKVTIINNGIDIERFSYNEGTRHSLRKELGLEGKFVLGHVGRFSDEKNHKFLIETFFRITQIYPRSILLLIGEGSLKPNIENKITELKLTENVIFLGLRDDVNQVMQAMDSFVLPSLFEGLGIVAIEAQAAGLPCYVSKGVPKEVDITDLITYISLNKSPEHWAQEIVKKKDSSSRSLYSKTIKSKNYDIVDTVKKLENFYYDIN